MKVLPLVLAAALAASPVFAADMAVPPLVDPKEPPRTPAGGAVEPPISTTAVVGLAIGLGVILALVGGDDDDDRPATATATGTN